MFFLGVLFFFFVFVWGFASFLLFFLGGCLVISEAKKLKACTKVENLMRNWVRSFVLKVFLRGVQYWYRKTSSRSLSLVLGLLKVIFIFGFTIVLGF